MREAGSPPLCVIETVSAYDLLRDASIPDVVQIGVGAAEADVDAVAATVDVLGVKRLVNVPEELNREKIHKLKV